MAPVVADMVARSTYLKQELLEFARRPRYAKALRAAIGGAGGTSTGGGDLIAHLDAFVLEHRLPDGRTLVDHFVAAHPDLPEADCAMLLGWRDVVEGLFEVDRRDGDAILLINLIDELVYRVHSNAGTGVFTRMPPGSFVLTRLVPVGDEWLFSGGQSLYPSSARPQIARVAAELAMERPALVFRNPEKLKRGWEIQRNYHEWFVEFFGADLVILPGAQIAERMRGYWRYCARRVGEKAGPKAGASPGFELPLPPGLTERATVGVISDEVDGLNFCADFGVVAEAFADPEIVIRQPQPYRRTVQHYLRDDSISALPFLRLAAQDEAKASRLFQLVLKRPSFSWQADGEALMRRRKPASFDRPALPSIIPISPIIEEHHRADQSDRPDRSDR
jgi:hypothetical protein